MSKTIERVGFVIALISLIVTIYTFFFNSPAPPAVSNPLGVISCSGFLINDPPDDLFKKMIPNGKEKEYLGNKINCYRDQIQKNPKDAIAYTNLGEANRRLGDLANARKAHNKALELNPKLAEAAIGLALVEQDSGNTRVADKLIQEVLTKNANAIAYFYKGSILAVQDRIQEAEVALKQAKKLNPGILTHLSLKG